MDLTLTDSDVAATIKDPKVYLQKHAVPQIIRSIVGGLMVAKPDDHFAYIKAKLLECKNAEEKLDIDWETFIYDLHPYRNEKRLELVHDFSPFYLEHLDKTGQYVPGLLHIENAVNPYEKMQTYHPELFKLTETVQTPEPPEQAEPASEVV